VYGVVSPFEPNPHWQANIALRREEVESFKHEED